MEHSLKTLPDGQVEITVNLDGAELRQYLAEVEKQLANNLRLSGFRPGKVPRELVRREVGEDKIKAQALELAIQVSCGEVLKTEQLEVIQQEAIKIKENSAEKLSYQITLSVFPRPTITGYTKLAIARQPINVSAEDVQHTLGELQRMRMVGTPATRAAQLGDRVEVDFTIRLNDQVIEGGQSENHPLVLGKSNFVPGFEEQVIGLQAGEEKNFSLVMPADYYQATIAGQTLLVTLKLKKVEALVLPVLDDDFAKKLGHFNSLAELTTNIKEGLQLEKQQQEKERIRSAILAAIAKENKFPVPTILIEQRLDRMLAEFDHQLHSQGMELGPYLAHVKKTQAELRQEWRVKAESQAKAAILIRAIGRQEKLQAEPEEVEQELAVLADQYAKHGKLSELQAADPGLLKDRVQELLGTEKVLAWLEEHN